QIIYSAHALQLDIHLAREEFNQAGAELAALQQLSPSMQPTIRYHIRVLLAQGRSDEAFEVIMDSGMEPHRIGVTEVTEVLQAIGESKPSRTEAREAVAAAVARLPEKTREKLLPPFSSMAGVGLFGLGEGVGQEWLILIAIAILLGLLFTLGRRAPPLTLHFKSYLKCKVIVCSAIIALMLVVGLLRRIASLIFAFTSTVARQSPKAIDEVSSIPPFGGIDGLAGTEFATTALSFAPLMLGLTSSAPKEVIREHSYELSPPTRLDDPEFLLKAQWYKEQIAQGAIKRIVIADWPKQSKELNKLLSVLADAFETLGIGKQLESHKHISGMELLREVSTWGVEHLVFTIGAQTHTREQLRTTIRDAIEVGAADFFVVSGSAPLRRIYSTVVDVLSSVFVTILTGGMLRREVDYLRETYLSMNSLEILDLLGEMARVDQDDAARATAERLKQMTVWVALNPYKKGDVEHLRNKLRRWPQELKRPRVLTQATILDEAYETAWIEAQDIEDLAGKIHVGLTPVKAKGALKFIYLLVNVKTPRWWLPDNPDLTDQELHDEITSSSNKLLKEARFLFEQTPRIWKLILRLVRFRNLVLRLLTGRPKKIIERLHKICALKTDPIAEEAQEALDTFNMRPQQEWNRDRKDEAEWLPGFVGFHHMPAVAWVDLAGQKWLREKEQALRDEISSRINVPIEAGEDVVTSPISRRALCRTLLGVKVLLDNETLDAALLGQRLARIYFIKTVKTNTFQPAVQLREIVGAHQYDMIIDLRQFGYKAPLKKIEKGFMRVMDKQLDSADGLLVRDEFTRLSLNPDLWRYNEAFWLYFIWFQMALGVAFDTSIGASPARSPEFVKDRAAALLEKLKEEYTGNNNEHRYYVEIGTAGAEFVRSFIGALIELAADDSGISFEYISNHLIYVMADVSPTVIDDAKKEMGAVEQGGKLIADFRGIRIEFIQLEKGEHVEQLETKYGGKIIWVHSTNTYDNLKVDKFARLNGQYYSVESRVWVPNATMRALALEFDLVEHELRDNLTHDYAQEGNGLGFIHHYQ
ncbi:hypothetical protein ACFL38_05435, partial [Candidatus Omnitrophota bacterium]